MLRAFVVRFRALKEARRTYNTVRVPCRYIDNFCYAQSVTNVQSVFILDTYNLSRKYLRCSYCIILYKRQNKCDETVVIRR